MPFSTDRDLLVLEPNLFRDVGWSAQTRLTASDGALAGVTLSSASSDFVGAGVAPGMVVLVNEAALEVVGVVSATELTVSRLRDDPEADAPIPPLAATGASVRITGFGAQRGLVHAHLLAALGLDPAPGSAPAPGDEAPALARRPSAADVVNTRDLAMVEALGTAHLILSSAAALVGEHSTLWTKAALHRDRFDHARRRLAARLDLNGDGVVDASRHITVAHLTRR